MACAKPLPLYEQLKEHVLQNIRSGAWRTGARVPSEYDLVREFKVSRMTANRALRELMRSGVLARVAGVGTFVGDFKAAGHPLQIRNIADEIRSRGHRHRARLVTLERLIPSQTVRGRLGSAAAHTSVFHSLVVHFENDAVLQVEDRYVNPLLAPDYLGVDFETVTPHEYLMEVAPLQRVEHVVRAVLPEAPIRALLKLRAHEPALLIERVTWSCEARASFALLYHPGSRFELRGGFAV
ncbi:MAG TPA: histidine utilization repressor [Steroidobacteraceae bacterium]